MKKKFKTIKDRQRFYRDLSDVTGHKPDSIKCNWFGKLYLAVPTNITDMVDAFIDDYLLMEKENQKSIKENRIKFLGKWFNKKQNYEKKDL